MGSGSVASDLTIRSSRARFAVSDQPSRIARAGLTQALGPMTFNPAAASTVVAGIAVFGLGFATWVVSERFFRKLIAQHPELSQSFPKPMFGTRYGPILPSKMDYLKQRRFNDLADPELKRMGQLSRTLLTSHAIAFTCFILSALWWGAVGTNGA